ncbi:MAG: hypothetical protein A2416_02885 [Candidatus Staskawiczbacteria bacterium RIFOXYC1_FULL_37_52]|nr:MAG: hypothetical protein A2416_02885 [Candidatus Staskawiczbacteria bacterium RIFOXYC1_FULL_37_52]
MLIDFKITDSAELPTDIKKEESDFLKSYLNKNSVALEWGSGWSTVEFAKYAKEYHSIEHDFCWYRRVKNKIGKNTRIYYAPPDTEDLKWFPPEKRGDNASFRNYIKFAGVLGSLGKRFDIVFIDGRARLECFLEALDYLNSKAVVFIHDFQRPHYWDAIKHYRIVDIIGNMAALEKNNSLCREKDRYFLIKKYLWMS